MWAASLDGVRNRGEGRQDRVVDTAPKGYGPPTESPPSDAMGVDPCATSDSAPQYHPCTPRRGRGAT